jgi:tetratricopeptide (TPR) repeat protein
MQKQRNKLFKKNWGNMKNYLLSASVIFSIMNISACEDWSHHYVKGAQFYQNKQYEIADIAFSEAVNLTKNEKDESHIFIRINRAKNFLQLDECYKALEDINEVIDCPSLSKKDLINALEIRMRAYAGLEMHSRFNEDYIWYKSVNPNMPIFEYTEKFIVIRHCETMEKNDQEILYGLFVASGLCEDVSKITQLDDLIIIERNNKEGYRCPCGPCNTEEMEAENEKKKKLEGCYWHCNIVAGMASEMAGKLIQINPVFFPTLIMIEILNCVCKDCCGDNGGFYMNCIEPIREYYEIIKIKIKQLINNFSVNDKK